MRLIDADALVKKFQRNNIFSIVKNGEDKNVIEIIEEQPTAYSVEKVVEELEEDTWCRGRLEGHIPKWKAIEIVKRGGRDEAVIKS